MIGLPTETDGGPRRARRRSSAGILAQGRKHGRKNVNVSVGSFVPKSWTPFQWAPFDGVEILERKLAYLKEKFRSVRGAKMKWHEPREAEIECVLSRGDRRVGRILHAAWKSRRALRRLDRALPLRPLDEGLRGRGHPEGVVPARLRPRRDPAVGRPRRLDHEALAPDRADQGEEGDAHRGLQVGPLLRLRRPRQRRGHGAREGRCQATARPSPAPPRGRAGERPPPPTATSPRAPRTARRRCRSCRPRRAAPTQGDRVFRHRVTFSKTGDARFLSHRNTMDVLERAIRAAGLPARYSEGFNPHMKLSMGPALALGLESRDEVFDVEGIAPFAADAAARICAKLPAGLVDPRGRAPLAEGEPSLAKAVKARPLQPCASRPTSTSAAPATPSPNGWREAMPALRALSLEADAGAGRACASRSTSTRPPARPRPRRRSLERLLAIPPPKLSRPPCLSCAKPPSSADVPRHRHGPLRGRAQPDRLRGRPRAAPRPLVPRRGGARGREAPALRRGRRLRPGEERAGGASRRNSTTRYINDHPAFRGRNTSAENLALYFAERLARRSAGRASPR